MKILLILLLIIPVFVFGQNPVLSSSTNLNVTKTWSQESTGFTFSVNVHLPTGPPPVDGFPVCVLLHGNGGNGFQIIQEFKNTLTCHILVAPSGYENSWNICTEDSDAPDVELVTDLVNNIQTYSNVNANKIRVLGTSNGGGLVNNLFIQNDNTGIDILCAIVSHLNEPQYHYSDFYMHSSTTDPNSANCGYNTQKTPLNSRKYLSISNNNDQLIPYQGGSSPVGLDFLHAETAVYYIALNQGYVGTQLNVGNVMSNPSITEYAYLNNQVVHIEGDAGHTVNASQLDYVKRYFEDCGVTLDIEDVQSGVKDITVQPNPIYNSLMISHIPSNVSHYVLVNIFGEILLSGQTQSNSLFLDLAHLAKGIYFLKINDQVIKVLKEG